MTIENKSQTGKSYAAIHFVTTLDEDKLSREEDFMRSAGFTFREIQEAREDRFRSSIPPVSLQRLAGFYGILMRPEGVSSFGVAGDNEGAIVNFAFRTLSLLSPSKANAPIIITGNGGYALQILLAKANERTLAERLGTRLREGDNDFLDSSYGKILSLLLDNSDKWGVNYTNRYSKVIFDPGEFDFEPSLPCHIPARRMFEAKDWDGILVLARAACEQLAGRAVNIADNQKGLPLGELKNKKRQEGVRLIPAFPDPGAKSLYYALTGKAHRETTWEDVKTRVLRTREEDARDSEIELPPLYSPAISENQPAGFNEFVAALTGSMRHDAKERESRGQETGIEAEISLSL
mgnify:FL=1